MTTTDNGAVRLVGPDVAQTFTEALEAVGSGVDSTSADGEHSSRCPGHPDQVSSLRWRTSRDGRLLFHCHAGCDGSEILKAANLEWWQIRPVSVEFDYYTPEGEYSFTVSRKYGADDSKRFDQGVRQPDGSISPGREGRPDALWRADELAPARGGTLWLCEGEKDAWLLQGWLTEAGKTDEQATTAPGGAAHWTDALTEAVREVGAKNVVLVCDRDNAGMSRGLRLSETLTEALGPDVNVGAVLVAPGRGKDLGELIDRENGVGQGALIPLAEAPVLMLAEGSDLSGRLMRVSSDSGSMCLAVHTYDDKVKRAIAGDIEVTRTLKGAGWEVRTTSLMGVKREVPLLATNLQDGRALGKWLVESAGLGRPAGSQVGIGDLAHALPTFLEWDAKCREVPEAQATEYASWVDRATGKPAQDLAGVQDLVWVNSDGSVLWSQDEGRDLVLTRQIPDVRWGLAGSEESAKQVWLEVLGFAEEATVAAVAGWVGSVILAPWLARWLPVKPGLAMVAPSGSGKTYGAGRMLLQLGGVGGHLTASKAAYRRLLGSGVSVGRWLDDSDLIEDHDLKELLRVATARSEHHLADVDAGAGGTAGLSLVGCPIVSAEGVSWLKETAMQDRFVVVEPANPQARLSKRPGRENQPQWADVVEVRDTWGGDLTSLAGWTVRGVAEQAKHVTDWLAPGGEIDSPRRRTEVPAVAVQVGCRALVGWLGDEAAWLVEEADRQRKIAHERSLGPRVTLTSVLLPAILSEYIGRTQVRGNPSSTVLMGVPTDEAGLNEAIRGSVAVQGTKDVRLGLPTVLVDTDHRIWVRLRGLSEWAERRWRSHGEVRLYSENALAGQLNRVVDDPEWAHYENGRGDEVGGLLIRIGGGDSRLRAVYRRLSEQGSETALGGD